jgi:hypothetical protein
MVIAVRLVTVKVGASPPIVTDSDIVLKLDDDICRLLPIATQASSILRSRAGVWHTTEQRLCFLLLVKQDRFVFACFPMF